MNIYTLINFFRFKKTNKITFDNNITEGVYRNSKKGVVLLQNGKVISDDYKYFSKNLIEQGVTSNDHLFYGEKANGEIDIFDVKGNNLTPTLYQKVGRDNLDKHGNIICLGNRGFGEKLIIIPSKGFISETYKFVGDYNAQGLRKVITEENRYSAFGERKYYLDKNGNKMFFDFISETEIPGTNMKIVKVKKLGVEVVHICSQDFTIISEGFKEIEIVDGKLIAVDSKGNKFYIDKNGVKKTGFIEDTKKLNNGLMVIKEKGKRSIKIVDDNFKTLKAIRRATVFEEAGIIVGLHKKTPVMFGYNTDILYTVDEAAARLMVSKLMGKRMSPVYVNKVIENESSIIPTIQTFEKLVKENLEIDQENEVLKSLDKNARKVFLRSLNATSANRIRRCEKSLQEIEQTKLALLSRSKTLKEKQEAFEEFKAKIKEKKARDKKEEKGE